jgi:uncharacterized protein (DUF2236 family)
MHGHIRGALPAEIGAWEAGSAYQANDPAALLWVLATLLDTTIQVYERSLGRLSDRTICAYLHEGARLGAMLGVLPESVPGDRHGLEQYISSMIAERRVYIGPAAKQVAVGLLGAQVMPGAAWRVYKLATHAVAATTMPEELRLQYGSILALHHPWVYATVGAAGRVILPRLPRRMRLDPIAAIAIDRAKLKSKPHHQRTR